MDFEHAYSLSAPQLLQVLFVNVYQNVHPSPQVSTGFSTLFGAEVSAESLQGSIGDFGLQAGPSTAVKEGNPSDP